MSMYVCVLETPSESGWAETELRLLAAGVLEFLLRVGAQVTWPDGGEVEVGKQLTPHKVALT